MSAKFEEKFASNTDGLKIHYRDYKGDGAPVLCLPGLTRNLRDFEDVADRLAKNGRRVICLSFRGRGRSDYDADPKNYTPLKYVVDAIAVLNDAGADRAIYLGTSLGGIVTMATAALLNDRVVAAILNDIGGEIAQAGLERIKAYAGVTPEIKNWAQAADYARSINKSAFPHYGDQDWMRFAERVFHHDKDETFHLDYDPKIGDAARTGGPPDLWPLFAALVETPTLVIRGETSDILSSDILARMKKEKADLRTFDVAGVGHAPMLDEPGVFDEIDTFLNGLPTD